jgi:hypothetical protein
MDWFAVDKEGLASILERKGKASAVLELIQNAWDEDGVTRVSVTLHDAPKRGRSLLVVEDDAPEGFADLTHAFTLFAPSGKVTDAAKRGRFNLGEKLVLAICDSATVLSTRGGWEFSDEGRKRLRKTTIAGSRFEALIRLTDAERAEVFTLIETLLPPKGIVTTLNGVMLSTREPVRTFTAALTTEVADADGILRRSKRQTTVRLYEPLLDEKPHLYEMGIPVVIHEGRWHIDIAQKVPLSFERDGVTPAYLREVRVAVLNSTHDLLTEADATSTWVKEAASDKRAEPEAVTRVMTQRFGEKAVAYDPHDSEANAEAVLQGYTVVHGGSLSGDEWEQAKRSGVLRPAGKVTPSARPKTSADGKPPLDESKWTPAMHRVAEYAERLAKDLIGEDLYVEMHSTAQPFAAWYSQGTLSFNLMRLGHRWFNEADPHKVDALLIHEFAHDRVSDHLSHAFHDECCRLGALLRDSSVRLGE